MDPNYLNLNQEEITQISNIQHYIRSGYSIPEIYKEFTNLRPVISKAWITINPEKVGVRPSTSDERSYEILYQTDKDSLVVGTFNSDGNFTFEYETLPKLLDFFFGIKSESNIDYESIGLEEALSKKFGQILVDFSTKYGSGIYLAFEELATTRWGVDDSMMSEITHNFRESLEIDFLVPENLVVDIQATANALRDSGVIIEINHRRGTISIERNAESLYFADGDEFSDWFRKVPDNVNEEDYILWELSGSGIF